MPAIDDKGSGSSHLASHMRTFTGEAAGGGVGQLTQVLTPVVKGGYFWRLFGCGLVHDSAASQNASIYLSPEGATLGAIDSVRIPVLNYNQFTTIAIPAAQLHGGTPNGCVVPPGWRVILECATVAAGESVYGWVAYLELPIGDHCYV